MVSIIVPVFNMQEWITDTIQSVINQSYEDWELILSDDGSTDATLEIAASFNDSRIKIFPNKENLGATKALNGGIKLSRGEYIALLAGDDLLTKDSIKNRLTHMRMGDMLVCGQAISIGPSCSLKRAYSKTHQPSRFRYFYGPTNMLRRAALERYGLFDEHLPARIDREMWVRLFGLDKNRSDRGTFTCLPDVLGYYRIRPDSIQQNYKLVDPAIKDADQLKFERAVKLREDLIKGVDFLEVRNEIPGR